MADKGYWESYEDADVVQSGGGRGGIIGLATIDTVFKVFTGAVPQEQTFFSADARDKAAMEAAKTTAQALSDQYGAGEIRWCLQLAIPKETAYRVQDGEWKKVPWNVECRYWPVPTWTQAAKEVLRPSVQAAGVTGLPATIWCRVGFQDNPYNVSRGEAGKTETAADGTTKRFPTVPYIIEAFDNEAAAMAAMSGEETADTPAVPDGWKFEGGPEGWEATVRGLKERGPKPAVLASLKALAAEKLPEEIGEATVEDVEAWWDFV